MVQQIEITLKPKRRGFHLVTSEILSLLPKLPKTGIVNIFTKHTSCGLSINEHCDPDVRVDMETIFNRLVPENRPEYEHTLEGACRLLTPTCRIIPFVVRMERRFARPSSLSLAACSSLQTTVRLSFV